jgi:hypothetical protein
MLTYPSPTSTTPTACWPLFPCGVEEHAVGVIVRTKCECPCATSRIVLTLISPWIELALQVTLGGVVAAVALLSISDTITNRTAAQEII